MEDRSTAGRGATAVAVLGGRLFTAEQAKRVKAERQRVGAYLRTCRKSLGLTLRDVQAKTGRNFTTLSKIENGHEEAGRDLLGQLAAIYGVPRQTMFTMAGRCAHCWGTGRTPIPSLTNGESDG